MSQHESTTSRAPADASGDTGTYRMLTRTTIGAVSDARYRALAAFGRRVPVRHIEEASRTGPRWLIGVTNSDIACDVRVR